MSNCHLYYLCNHLNLNAVDIGVKIIVETIHELSLQGFLDTISGIILILGVFMAVMSILPKSNDQLIADGKAKSGH